jgi:glucose-6-phosphate isomerase
MINETESWARLETNKEAIKGLHLRDLLQDTERCAALTAEHNGFVLDYSRQCVTTETMDLLFDLADSAHLPQKKVRRACRNLVRVVFVCLCVCTCVSPFE